VSAPALTEGVARPAEHAHRLVPGQDQVAVVHCHIQHVALADAERVSEVGGEHHPPERVDAPGAILRAHVKRVGRDDIWSVL